MTNIQIKFFKIDNEKMYLEYASQFIDGFNDLVVRNRDTGEEFKLSYELTENGLCIALNQFNMLSLTYGRFDFLFRREVDYKIVFPQSKNQMIFQRYHCIFESMESPIGIFIYFTLRQELALLVRNVVYTDAKEREFIYQHSIDSLSISKSAVDFKCHLNLSGSQNYQVESIILQLDSNIEMSRIFSDEINYDKNNYELSFSFRIKDFDIVKPIRYLLYVRVSFNDSFIYLPLNKVSEKFYDRYHSTNGGNYFSVGGSQLFEAVLSKDGFFRFVLRKKSSSDGLLVNLKSQLAKVKCGVSKKSIMLIYEKNCFSAQDNGFAFFKYLYNQEHVPFEFYFVINKNSPQATRLSEYSSRVIYQYSVKFFRMLRNKNTFLVSSESRLHIGNLDRYSGELFRLVLQKKHVFLQHGVIAFKKVPMFNFNTNGGTDLFLVSSENERMIAIKNLNYPADLTKITGLSRWDNLYPVEKNKSILFMPTWRNWLEGYSSDDLKKTEYFHAIHAFLSSEELSQVLKRNGWKLLFCPHPKVNVLFKQLLFQNDCIEFVDNDKESISDLVRSSRMLITDYSSILWDFLYQKKPVFLYQFDIEEYQARTGSYISFETVFNHEIAYSLDDLVNTVDKVIKSQDFSTYLDRISYSDFFLYNDESNSERIYRVIIDNLDYLLTSNKEVSYDSILSNYKKQEASIIKKNTRYVENYLN